MISFKKKELEFLSYYDFCKDNKRVSNDKFYIRKINNYILFMQLSNDVNLFTLLERDSINDEFSAILPTKEFYRMLSFCKDEDDIVFTEDSIKFGNNSKYTFESYNELENIYDVNLAFSIIENLESYKKIDLTDINKLKEISFCIGNNEFNIFSLQNNFFVANDGKFLTSAIKTDNNCDNYWFPSIIFNLFKFLKLNNVQLYLYDDQILYKSDNTYFIFSQVENPVILEIFNDENRKYYEHSNKIRINKEELKNCLNRISSITDNLINNKISISFEENNKIILKNIFGISGEEILIVKFPIILVDQHINVNVFSFIKTIDKLDGDLIISLPDNLEEANVVKIETDNNIIEKFFIMNLMGD